MARFDFIEAGAKGYEFVWNERKYLARVAFPVVFVKVACLLAIFVFGAQDLHLRQGLIMFPGYIVEALLVIGAIRYVLYGENIFIWGRAFPPPMPRKLLMTSVSSMNRVQCIQAGVAVYLLVRLFEAFVVGYVASYQDVLTQDAAVQPPPEPNMLSAFLALTILWLLLWAFRLYWLFIPVAMGWSMKNFLVRIKGFESSLYMMGTFFICALPTMLIFGVLLQSIQPLIKIGPELYIFTDAIVRSVYEVVLALIVSIAMTYGFVEILSGKQRKP